MKRNPSMKDFKRRCSVCKESISPRGHEMGAAVFGAEFVCAACAKERRIRKYCAERGLDYDEYLKEQEEERRREQERAEEQERFWDRFFYTAKRAQAAKDRALHQAIAPKHRRIEDKFSAHFSHPVRNPKADVWRESSKIQTLLFDKRIYSVSAAKAWARRHDFKYGKTDVGSETSRFIRLRQYAPDSFVSGHLRTITLKPGIQAVVGEPQKARKNPNNFAKLAKKDQIPAERLFILIQEAVRRKRTPAMKRDGRFPEVERKDLESVADSGAGAMHDYLPKRSKTYFRLLSELERIGMIKIHRRITAFGTYYSFSVS